MDEQPKCGLCGAGTIDLRRVCPSGVLLPIDCPDCIAREKDAEIADLNKDMIGQRSALEKKIRGLEGRIQRQLAALKPFAALYASGVLPYMSTNTSDSFVWHLKIGVPVGDYRRAAEAYEQAKKETTDAG